MMECSDSRKVKLSQILDQGFKKFTYTYDFGDNWDHTILIEKTLPAESGVRYPRCTAGKGACPPEDCGGPWGYASLLEAIRDPSHPEHEEMTEWLGGEFDIYIHLLRGSDPHATQVIAIERAIALRQPRKHFFNVGYEMVQVLCVVKVAHRPPQMARTESGRLDELILIKQVGLLGQLPVFYRHSFQ